MRRALFIASCASVWTTVSAMMIAVAFVLGVVTQARAHQLEVFVSVEGSEVEVEAEFSDGEIPKSGNVQVFDDRDRLIHVLQLGAEGTARFPVSGGSNGLRIEVDVGGGHSSYWILTPADIEAGTIQPDDSSRD